MLESTSTAPTTRPPTSLRAFLAELETAGELVRVPDEVSPQYEASAIVKALDRQRGPAVLFERIAGHEMPLVANVLGTRARLARALRAADGDLHATYLERKQRRLPPIETTNVPVQEVVLTEGIDLAHQLPILTYHEQDATPYITSGVVIARDPEAGTVSTGIHRLAVKGPAKLGALLVSPPIAEYFAKAEQRGQPLEVAIAIGLDPAAVFACVSWVPFGEKLAVAGAMRQAPLPVGRGITVDLPVPAESEIVLEGRVLPGVREEEGPFGETSGYYLAYQSPVIEITAVTRRRDAIFHAIHPMSADTFMLLGPAWEAELLGQLRAVSRNVRSLYLTPESSCMHAVVSVAKQSKSEARAVGIALATSNPFLKQVTVVDAEIDPSAGDDVEWAIATRFQPERDLIVLPNLPGSPIDPSAGPGSATGKLVFDATFPAAEQEKFTRIGVPANAEARAREILKRLI